MKKVSLLILGVAVVGLVFLAFNASAHKYQRKQYTPPEENTSAESMTSMSDCMSFSSSFTSRGKANDAASFKREFGTPLGSTGRTTTYNYDQYTQILLDCPGGKCNCRCLGK